jgi:hypothetical protein
MNVILTITYTDGTTEKVTVKRGQHFRLVQALRNAGAIVTGTISA